MSVLCTKTTTISGRSCTTMCLWSVSGHLQYNVSTRSYTATVSIMYNKHGTHKHVHTHTHTTHMQKAYLSDNCCQPSLAHIPMDSDHFRNRKFHPELDNGTAWYNPHQKGMVDKLKKPRAIRPNKQNTCAYRYSSIWQSNSGDEPKSQAQVN